MDSSGRAQAVAFAVLALALATGLALGARLDVPVVSDLAIAYGWTPALAALVVLLVSAPARTRRPSLGLADRGFPGWPVALAVPAAVMSAGYLVVALSGSASVQLGPGGAVVRLVGKAVALVAAATASAMGEEIGWRGFLLPRLRPIGRGRAGLTLGLVWTAWHYPLILLGSADPIAQAPRLALFTATIVGLGVLVNELRIATGSTWPAALAHGTHNAAWSLLAGAVVVPSAAIDGRASSSMSPSSVLDLVAGETGLVTVALYACVATWILLRREQWSTHEHR